MWYPSPPTSWHPHPHPSVLPTHASYYRHQNGDDSSMQNPSTTCISPSETSMHHYQGSYEMRHSDPDPSPPDNTHGNPIRAAATKASPSSSSTSWDWLLYSPDFDPQLYRPPSSSSHFIQTMKYSADDDEGDLLTSLPSWLLALLTRSNQRMDEENEMDQEIRSLHHHRHPQHEQRYERDEPSVSSNRPLSSDPLHSQQTSKEQHRSSTPDTDDGYQSASDAGRSDYSQPTSTSTAPIPPRISYAAAVKPLPVHPSFFPSNRKSSVPSSLLAMNDCSTNGTNQKLKFIAPRFERMHHAKQYSTSTMMTMTTKSRSNPHGRRR